MKRFRTNIAAALMICCAIGNFAAAQHHELQTPISVNGDNNEDAKAELDLLAAAAGKDKLIIMIARLGSRESTRSLNHRRLQTALSYLETVRAIPKQRIILAEGETVQGLGRIEVYLDGKLFMVFMLKRNRNFAPEP